MPAELIDRSRTDCEDGSLVEIVIWRGPRPLRGSAQKFKYRLASVVDGMCVVRFDDEAGKRVSL